MEFVDKCFAPVRHAVWCGIVAEAMANTEKIPAPPESGIAGMFFEHLEEFLTNRQRGTKVEDLLSGRSFEDEEHGVYYFRLKDLEAHLKREGLKDMTRPQITSRLRTIGGESKQFNIKNKHSVNAWSIPTKGFNGYPILDVPEADESEI